MGFGIRGMERIRIPVIEIGPERGFGQNEPIAETDRVGLRAGEARLGMDQGIQGREALAVTQAKDMLGFRGLT